MRVSPAQHIYKEPRPGVNLAVWPTCCNCTPVKNLEGQFLFVNAHFQVEIAPSGEVEYLCRACLTEMLLAGLDMLDRE